MSVADDDGIKRAESKASEDSNEFYDWEMVPKVYSEECKTGVTFKGDSEKYIEAHGKLILMMNRKGSKYLVNGREIRILDNVKNKPIKVEVRPLKGPLGKANIKIYNINGNGGGTIMVQKVREGELLHVKALAFKVVKYIIDGIIDGEITDDDINSFNVKSDTGNPAEALECVVCGKSFKTNHGLNIHISKKHSENVACSRNEQSQNSERTELHCKVCNFAFMDNTILENHTKVCHTFVSISGEQSTDEKMDCEQTETVQCDYCDMKIASTDLLQGLRVIKKHQEECLCKPKTANESIVLYF
jgi:hypothetical protein